MPPPSGELDGQEILRMNRRELIARLLELNNVSSFQFTPPWLNKQWTERLRSLVLATQRQHGPKE
jgi:hypothetical protein